MWGKVTPPTLAPPFTWCMCGKPKITLSAHWQKVNGPGFAEGEWSLDLHLTYFNYLRIAHLLYSTNKQRKRSILTKLTYWNKGTTQELPNQLVLQTGHRNTLAKSVP